MDPCFKPAGMIGYSGRNSCSTPFLNLDVKMMTHMIIFQDHTDVNGRIKAPNLKKQIPNKLQSPKSKNRLSNKRF